MENVIDELRVKAEEEVLILNKQVFLLQQSMEKIQEWSAEMVPEEMSTFNAKMWKQIYDESSK